MEIAQAYQYSIAAMNADSALLAVCVGGIWQDYADPGAVGIVGLVSHQSDSDRLTMNAKRLFADILLQIKVIGPATQYASLVIGANRIDALFGRNGPVGLVGGIGGVLSSYRDGEVAYSELTNGVQYCHAGGLYRLALQGV